MSNFKKKYEDAIRCYIDAIVLRYGTVGVNQKTIASNVRKHLPLLRRQIDLEIIDRLVSEAFIKFRDEND